MYSLHSKLECSLEGATVGVDYLLKVYTAAKQTQSAGNLGDRMIADFGNLDMGASYQWDAVFPDDDLDKASRLEKFKETINN